MNPDGSWEHHEQEDFAHALVDRLRALLNVERWTVFWCPETLDSYQQLNVFWNGQWETFRIQHQRSCVWLYTYSGVPSDRTWHSFAGFTINGRTPNDCGRSWADCIQEYFFELKHGHKLSWAEVGF